MTYADVGQVRARLLVTPPVAEPVGVDELRRHLRLPDGTEDGLLLAYLHAARERVEHDARRQLVAATWKFFANSFPPCSMSLRVPLGRLLSVSALTYLDPSGVRQTLAGGDYYAVTSEEPGRLHPTWGESWPCCRVQPESVQVTARVGYGDAADDVPRALRQAILMLAGDLYERREAQLDVAPVTNPAVEALIRSHTVYDF
mgnify:CR=1 FL=1